MTDNLTARQTLMNEAKTMTPGDMLELIEELEEASGIDVMCGVCHEARIACMLRAFRVTFDD